MTCVFTIVVNNTYIDPEAVAQSVDGWLKAF